MTFKRAKRELPDTSSFHNEAHVQLSRIFYQMKGKVYCFWDNDADTHKYTQASWLLGKLDHQQRAFTDSKEWLGHVF